MFSFREENIIIIKQREEFYWYLQNLCLLGRRVKIAVKPIVRKALCVLIDSVHESDKQEIKYTRN